MRLADPAPLDFRDRQQRGRDSTWLQRRSWFQGQPSSLLAPIRRYRSPRLSASPVRSSVESPVRREPAAFRRTHEPRSDRLHRSWPRSSSFRRTARPRRQARSRVPGCRRVRWRWRSCRETGPVPLPRWRHAVCQRRLARSSGKLPTSLPPSNRLWYLHIPTSDRRLSLPSDRWETAVQRSLTVSRCSGECRG